MNSAPLTSDLRPPTSAPVQRAFDLGLATGRPFFSINAVMGLLNQEEDDILNLIELGRLEYAFDIRSAGAAKREPRVLAQSVTHYLKWRASGAQGECPSLGKSLDQILRDLWPHQKPTLRISEIYRCWNCSSQHVLTLWREGHFGPTPDLRPLTSAQRTSPVVPRPLVINFLKSRRLP